MTHNQPLSCCKRKHKTFPLKSLFHAFKAVHDLEVAIISPVPIISTVSKHIDLTQKSSEVKYYSFAACMCCHERSENTIFATSGAYRFNTVVQQHARVCNQASFLRTSKRFQATTARSWRARKFQIRLRKPEKKFHCFFPVAVSLINKFLRGFSEVAARLVLNFENSMNNSAGNAFLP